MEVKFIKYFSVIILIFLSFHFVQAQNNQKDELGRKQGKWIKYKDGVKAYEGQFVDDYPYGEFLRYYPSGRLMSKSYFSEKGNKSMTEFYYDNRKNLVKAKGQYLHQKKDSLWLIYNEAGVLVSEEWYKNGKANGIWKLYTYLGVLVKETPYKNGIIQGEQKEYFSNGQLQRSIFFTNDSINGPFKVYFEDGDIRINGQFKKGLKDSKWTYCQENDSIWFIEEYDNGLILKRIDTKGHHFEMKQEVDSIKLDIDPSVLDLK